MARRKKEKSGCIPGATGDLSYRFDVIGDIAIVNVPGEFRDRYADVAKTVVGKRKNIKTVLNRVSAVDGDFRVAGFRVIYGGPDTVTVHRESGFSYMLDLSESFFNPRLCTERMRVAALVEEGERVVVPFAGVGPFAVPPAKKGAFVYAVEKNPSACTWLRKNAGLNSVAETLETIRGDAADLPEIFKSEFDRAIVPAPYGFDDALHHSASVVRRGGKIHFYTFKRPSQIAEVSERYRRSGLEVENVRRCGNVAKGISRWVFDLKKI